MGQYSRHCDDMGWIWIDLKLVGAQNDPTMYSARHNAFEGKCWRSKAEAVDWVDGHEHGASPSHRHPHGNAVMLHCQGTFHVRWDVLTHK